MGGRWPSPRPPCWFSPPSPRSPPPGASRPSRRRRDGRQISDRQPGTIVEGGPDLGLSGPDPTVESAEAVELPLIVDHPNATTLTVRGENAEYELAATGR
ncbi:hypothetical protein BRC81_16235 [Halobacteriales archaeon QS_1_68_20]|nr:MAG: hypothetical protein BRC81_16235 [Halobacteriales archaeon QS_1_68_20]